jgi:hypothetical protein
MKQYEKLYKKVYSVTECFFKSHLEMVFLKFDSQLIINILNILANGMNDEVFDIASSAAITIDVFNEYVYTQLKRPKKK